MHVHFSLFLFSFRSFAQLITRGNTDETKTQQFNPNVVLKFFTTTSTLTNQNPFLVVAAFFQWN
jgi:hypothetical protein